MPSVTRARSNVKPDVLSGASSAAAGGRQRRLGKYANKSSPGRSTSAERAVKRRRKRRERHSLRYRLRAMTTLKRVRSCGHTPVGNAQAGPGLRLGSVGGRTTAGFTGLAHCGSVWACPVCSAKIATRRAEELSDVMRFALEKGCSASMVTLTMRHNKGQTLEQCWDALGYAWGRVNTGNTWVRDQASAGLQGWVKAVEVTHGKNGWHVHIHAMLIWRDSIGQESARRVGERMHDRWTNALQRKGFDSWRDQGGLDVRLASLKPGDASGAGLHEYFVKLSHELTGGQSKLARGEGRTPFQILTDVFDTDPDADDVGAAEDVDLWHEWERASLGRRQVAWSKGLREWAKLMPEQSDDDIAQEDIEGADLLMLTGESWRELRRSSDQVCDLLDAAERGGYAAAIQLLDMWGLEWLMGREAPKYPPPPPGHGLDRQQFLDVHSLGQRLVRAGNRHQAGLPTRID